MSLYYFGFFDNRFDLNDKRCTSPAALAKSNYLIDSLNKLGYKVFSVSGAWSTSDKGKFNKKLDNINGNNYLVFKSFGAKNKVAKFFRIFLLKRQVYRFFLKTIKEGDTIIVYHSIPYSKLFVKLKKKLNFNLILQVEEIYSNAIKLSRFEKKNEHMMIDIADSLIVVSDILLNMISNSRKGICFYGPYVNHKNNLISKFSKVDGKLHLVYSGTFDLNKGGSANIIRAVRHLNDKYVLHILGFGSNNEVEIVKDLITKENKSNNGCHITFDGLKYGNEFYDFLCKCDIGCSLQNKNNSFSTTSFPSKLLTYLGCGLNIISSSDECVKHSSIKNNVYFFDDDYLENGFEKNILKPEGCVIDKLDETFKSNLMKLF